MVTNLDIQRKVCFLDCLTLEDATDRLSRNVCKLTTNLRCVTSQKNEWYTTSRRSFYKPPEECMEEWLVKRKVMGGHKFLEHKETVASANRRENLCSLPRISDEPPEDIVKTYSLLTYLLTCLLHGAESFLRS